MVNATTMPEPAETRATKDAAKVYDIVALTIIIAGLCVYLMTAATIESFGSDTSTYYGLARSLRYDHRYWFNFQPHTQYPPGFPLLLAGLMALGVNSFPALVKACITVYFAGVAGVYVLLRRERGARIALAIVALLVASPVFYFWSTVGIHSEAAYFTTGILALLCSNFAETSKTGRSRLLGHVGVALIASYLLLVRSIGITFVVGLIFWLVLPIGRPGPWAPFPSWRRFFRWGVTIAVPVVVFVGWTAWSSAHKQPDTANDYMQTYVRQLLKEDPHQIDSPNVSLRSFPARTVRILGMRIENGTRVMVNVRSLPLGWKNPVCLLLFALVAAGWLISVRQRSTPAHWYLLCYMAMLLVYPFDEGTRYLHPVHPLLLLYGIDGLDALAHRARNFRAVDSAWRFGRLALLTAVLGAGAYQIFGLAKSNVAPDASGFLNAATVDSADWIKANTPPDAVVMDDQYAILHRLSGRKTLRFPLSTNPGVLREQITSNGVDFVVVLNERQYEYYNPSTMRRFRTLQLQYPKLFIPVHAFPNGTIYRVATSS